MSDDEVDKLVTQAVEKLNLRIDSGDMDDKLYKHTHEYLCDGVNNVLTESIISKAMINACKSIFNNMKTDGLEKTIKEFLERATLDACESKDGEIKEEKQNEKQDNDDEDEEQEQEQEEEEDVQEEEETKKKQTGGRRRKHKRTRKRKK